MENVLYNIGQVLGITIIHSLWQGLFIYFMLKLALFIGGKMPAAKKYMLALTSLAAIACWFFYTLVTEIQTYSWLAQIPEKPSAMPLFMELPAGVRGMNDTGLRYYYSIEKYLPFITILYIAGLLFNVSRLLLTNRQIKQVKQSMSIDIQLQRQVNKFAEMLGIEHRVKIGLSRLVDVPCMVGYFKPVILLPITLSTYLGAEEIEAILLHELAHIKRNDYLVNLLQQVISALLFFNPCAQLINKIINEERENCCDDLVVQSAPDPVVYAKALLKLEQTRENNMRTAMAATGKKYQLLSRIERIMKTKNQPQSLRPALLAMLILTAGIGFITLFNPQIAEGKISLKGILPVIKNLMSDTTHKTAKEQKIAAEKKAIKTKTKENIIISPYGISGDETLEKLTAEVEKHSQAISEYYDSPKLKQQIALIEQKSKAIEDYYNNPNVRKLHDEQENLNKMFESQSAEIEEISKQVEENSKKMSAYYNSKEFQEMISKLETKYNIPHKRIYTSRDTSQWDDNYKRFQSEISADMPSYIKIYKEQIAQMNKKMRAMHDSPEYRERSKHMEELSDSISATFNNTNISQQQIEMAQLSRKMKENQNSAAIEREQKLLQEASRRLQDYTKSRGFKNSLLKMKNFKYNYNFDFNDDVDRPEKPERPEAPKKPERPEQVKPEKPEQPEAPEAPEAAVIPKN